MKRILCLLTVFAVFLCICGCQNSKSEIIDPVQLYYCKANVSFQSENGLIASEPREYDGWENNIQEFLNEYLAGPVSSELKSPFPLGGRIVELSQKNSVVNLLLNVNFSRLSPKDLTGACACISMTVFELLNAEIVNIKITNYLSERDVITMTRSNLCLWDNEGI